MVKYKEGDEVLVHAVVRGHIHSAIELSFGSNVRHIYLTESEIASLASKPRELEVGDVVGLEGAPEHFRWTIIGLHGEWAWLSSADGAYASAKKIQIVRA